MSSYRIDAHVAKRPRLGERTMLACIGCKQKKLKVSGLCSPSPSSASDPSDQPLSLDSATAKVHHVRIASEQGEVSNFKAYHIASRSKLTTSLDCLVEDPGTGLHRPRDYMKSLEARVAYLEGLLQQARPEVALDHFGPGEGDRDADSSPAPPGPAPAATSPPMPVRQMPSSFPTLPEPSSIEDGSGFPRGLQLSSVEADDQHVDVLSSEVALLCLNAAGREPHYFGPSSAVSFSRIVSVTMGLATGARGGSSQSTRGDNRRTGIGPEVPRDVPLRLPSPRLRANLSEAYFKNIHPQYPFLHKPTFDIWEESCMRASLEGSLHNVSGVSLFFVLMVSRAHHSVPALSGDSEVCVAYSIYRSTRLVPWSLDRVIMMPRRLITRWLWTISQLCLTSTGSSRYRPFFLVPFTP